MKSTLLTRCIVFLDNLTIALISEDYGAEIPFIRPLELAGDNSKTIDVLIHSIKILIVL